MSSGRKGPVGDGKAEASDGTDAVSSQNRLQMDGEAESNANELSNANSQSSLEQEPRSPPAEGDAGSPEAGWDAQAPDSERPPWNGDGGL